MGLVQYCVTVLMLSAPMVFTLPLTDNITYGKNARKCQACRAGEYQKSCTECEPCPAGSYTSRDKNHEDSCHYCFGDCRPEFHLKVIRNCTSKSNLLCMCEDGFRCTDTVPNSDNCKYCEKNEDATTTVAAAAIDSDHDKQAPSSASSGRSSTSTRLCRFAQCGPQPNTTPTNNTHLKREGESDSQLAAILCPVAAMGCIALVVLICIQYPGDETCFKQAIAHLCNKGGREGSHKSKESTHQFPRDSFSAKQQPSSLPAAKLDGLVHVHNPGTVIFSLLSQFTGQVGPINEVRKTAERVSTEEDNRDRPVRHATSSPSVPLSEEERSGDVDSIFFPSQEQGKDCHVSKEEAL